MSLPELRLVSSVPFSGGHTVEIHAQPGFPPQNETVLAYTQQSVLVQLYRCSRHTIVALSFSACGVRQIHVSLLLRNAVRSLQSTVRKRKLSRLGFRGVQWPSVTLGRGPLRVQGSVQFGHPVLLPTFLRCCNRVVSDEVDGNLNQVAKMIGSGNQGGGGWLSGLSEAWGRRRHRIAENRRFWALVEPYRPPPRLMPLLFLNTVAFYTGLVAAAVTEQLYKEKYWDEHPGAAVPIMHPMFYIGPYKVTREDFSEENA